MSNVIINLQANLVLDKQAEQKRKFEALKENQRKLDCCLKHHFPEWPAVISMGTKFHCTNCGGYMDAIHTYSYTKGYQAAGGNPVDIIPTWYDTFGKEQQEKSIVKGDGFSESNEDGAV